MMMYTIRSHSLTHTMVASFMLLTFLLVQNQRSLHRVLSCRSTMTKPVSIVARYQSTEAIENLFHESAATNTNSTITTKAGWCLKEGIRHVAGVDNGCLAPLIERHGLPDFYFKNQNRCRHDATQDIKDPRTCFQSLVRIVAGQFVSGKSAQAAWKRVLETSGNDLTPAVILQVAADDIESGLQKPAGLTKAKAASIVDLAQHFQDGRLSEDWLNLASEEDLRAALLKVRGIGPWSCDMFLLFYLERPNVLPLGDLGVRKGIAAWFGWRGSLPKGQLCPKKDATWINEKLEIYKPYQSILTYFMWRAADTPDSTAHNRSNDQPVPASIPRKVTKKRAVSTPSDEPAKKRASKKVKRVVTP
jgi:DNA-3-methyladenine glycosylase II